jgi:hypothetical protein
LFLVEQRSSWLLLLGALGKEKSVWLKNKMVNGWIAGLMGGW